MIEEQPNLFTEVESCEGSSCYVDEYYCNVNNEVKAIFFPCDSCINGRCSSVETSAYPMFKDDDQCADTDGGLDYFIYGVVGRSSLSLSLRDISW